VPYVFVAGLLGFGKRELYDPPEAETADIDVVEEMGSDDFVYLHVADVTWTAREEDRIDVADGTVAYGFDPHDVYLFGPDGRTIKSKGLDGDAADQSSETTTVGQSVS
jgi:hypothetical protein